MIPQISEWVGYKFQQCTNKLPPSLLLLDVLQGPLGPCRAIFQVRVQKSWHCQRVTTTHRSANKLPSVRPPGSGEFKIIPFISRNCLAHATGRLSAGTAVIKYPLIYSQRTHPFHALVISGCCCFTSCARELGRSESRDPVFSGWRSENVGGRPKNE